MWIESEKITLGAFLDHILNEVAAHIFRPKSFDAYAYLVRNHIKPELGDIKLSLLRPDHLQNLYSQKLNQGLSRRSVQYIHAVLHKALSQAEKWGLVVRNVADAVDAPRRKKRHLSSSQLLRRSVCWRPPGTTGFMPCTSWPLPPACVKASYWVPRGKSSTSIKGLSTSNALSNHCSIRV